MAWISPAGWRPGALEACRPLLLLMFNSGANELTRNIGPESIGSAELPSSFFLSVPCVQCFPKPAGSSPNLHTEVRVQNYHGDLVLNYQLPVLVSCLSTVAYGRLRLSGYPTCASNINASLNPLSLRYTAYTITILVNGFHR
ncbi:hypothetical protein F5146DRAFT_1002073 [Armillaria mellea]|nr:hypothetical protein F5146DRAFT_1002073 [Armillaria mellea]